MFKKLKRLFLLILFLSATLDFTTNALAQASQGNGVQPTEAQDGDVSLDTLNVHITIPIVQKSGIGLPLNLALNYNSNIWRYFLLPGAPHQIWAVGNTVETGWTVPQNDIGGYFIAYPSSCTVYSNPPVVYQGGLIYGAYVDPSGSAHKIIDTNIYGTGAQCFKDGVGTYQETDGSGFYLTYGITSTPTAVDPSGTVFYPSTTGFTTTAKVVDVNGNTISYNPSTGIITDTFGVSEVTITGTPASGAVNYKYPTSTGTATTVVNYTSVALDSNFGCSSTIDIDTSAYWPSSVVYPDGSEYQMQYNSHGQLTSITYPSGQVVSYSYSGSSGTCPLEWTSTTLVKTVTGDNTYTYVSTSGSAPLTTTKTVGVAGNVSVYTFVGSTSYYSFAASFLTQAVINQGASTPLLTEAFCYNGNLTSCPSAAAPTFPITETDVYTTPAGITVSSRVSKTFDTYQNMTKVALYDFGATTPTTQMVYGPFGYTWNGSTSSPTCTTSIGKSVNNKPCQIQMKNGSGGQLRNAYFAYGTTSNTGSLLSSAVLASSGTYLISSATYNSNGTLASSKDVNGNQTTYTYGQCSSGLLTKTVFANGLNSQNTWDSGCTGPVVVSAQGMDGNPATAVYSDPFWRPTSITDPTGITTSFQYTPTSKESILSWGTSTRDIYSEVWPSYNGVESQQLEAPSTTNWDTTLSYGTWNSTGRISSASSIPIVTDKSTWVTGTVVTTTTHDALARPLVTTDGGGGTTTISYTGSSSCVSSLPGCVITLSVLGPAPSGEVVKQVAYEKNGLGQTVATCEISAASGSTACGFGGYTGFPTIITYNTDGTVASEAKSSSTNTQTHSATYDAIGRRLTSVTPESATKYMYYDSAPSTPGVACSTTAIPGFVTDASPLGNLVKTYDANGTTTCYSYDNMKRVIARSYNGTNFDGANKYFVYDAATVNSVVMANAGGRLAEEYTSATSGGTKITDVGLSYTARGEVAYIYESTPNSTEYYYSYATYFPNGAISTLTDENSGVEWEYTVDGKGRLYSLVQGPSTNLVSSVTYNAANQPLAVTMGLGDTDTYTYDPQTGRMLTYAFSIGATPTTDVGTLVWNLNGTLRSLSIVDGFNSSASQTCNYGTSSVPGYNDRGELASVVCNNTGGTNVWGQSFTYDAFGNLTKQVPNGDTGITWSPIYSQTNNTFSGGTYDANGNLLTDGFHTYTWNQDNKLKTITDMSISNMSYDAGGTLLEWETGSTYTEQLLSPIGNIGKMNKAAIADMRIPLPGGSTSTGQCSGCSIFFVHQDWLASARLKSSRGNRTEVEDRAYAPYGEVYLPFGTATEVNFTGDNSDLTAGTYDTPNRELNPNTGRWLTVDPARSGWNPYGYSVSPLGEVDPTGLEEQAPDTGSSSDDVPWGCRADFNLCGFEAGAAISPLNGAGLLPIPPHTAIYSGEPLNWSVPGQTGVDTSSETLDTCSSIPCVIQQNVAVNATAVPVDTIEVSSGGNSSGSLTWAWNFTKSFVGGFRVFGPKNDPRPSCFRNFLKDAGSGFANSFAPPSPSPGEIVGTTTAVLDYANEVNNVAAQHLAQYGSRISNYTIGEQAAARAGLAGLLANADYQGAVALVNEYGSASSGRCK